MAFGQSDIWATFPTANNFSWVGIGFIYETDYKKPNPTKFSGNTVVPVLLPGEQYAGTVEGPLLLFVVTQISALFARRFGNARLERSPCF